MGVDFAFFRKPGWYGVQRKEIKDFIASVNDGRLAKEVQQMVMLVHGLVVIEGTVRFSDSGEFMGDGYGATWTRRAHDSITLSLQNEGVWVASTATVTETADLCRHFELWVRKGEHVSLKRRGPMATPWGRKENRDYQRHVIMSLPGVDLVLAERILDTLGMIVGLRVSEAMLMRVDGIGPKKAKAIVRALEAMPA